MFQAKYDFKPVVLTFHKGTQRSYIFLIHPEDYIRYQGIIDKVVNKWYRIFNEECINNKRSSEEIVGEPFALETSQGIVFTFSKRADGKISVTKSNDRSTRLIVEADHFCDRFRF